LETQESASFLKKRSKKLLISVGFTSVSAKCFRKSKFFCFFLFTKRSSYSPFDISKQPLRAQPLVGGPGGQNPFGLACGEPQTKEARQPMGRRAKFREETPVTRQNEEPNFTL
jgi:hypothetical protein